MPSEAPMKECALGRHSYSTTPAGKTGKRANQPETGLGFPWKTTAPPRPRLQPDRVGGAWKTLN